MVSEVAQRSTPSLTVSREENVTVKRLIGLSAVLSLSLLATAASAGRPPPRLVRPDTIARPAPVATEHFQRTATRASKQKVVREDTQTKKRSAPASVRRVQIRTDVVVGQAARTARPHATNAVVGSHQVKQNPVQSRLAQRARCEDSTACGSAPRARGETRTVNPNTQRDGVSEMRRKLRNERLYRMIMAKLMAKMHPGK